MTVWEKINEAQAKKQDTITVIIDGQPVQIKISQNGWYEDFESVS
jgi:hypothetical protein